MALSDASVPLDVFKQVTLVRPARYRGPPSEQHLAAERSHHRIAHTVGDSW